MKETGWRKIGSCPACGDVVRHPFPVPTTGRVHQVHFHARNHGNDCKLSVVSTSTGGLDAEVIPQDEAAEAILSRSTLTAG